MNNNSDTLSAQWARFRFTVIGTLLSSPPPKGQLQSALKTLAQRSWVHPISGQPLNIA